ncbi:MAG: sugar transferase, partial [Kiritimatiellia bacterium]|nr:sugar transferase [Kiritimatiellia bacterium]
MPGMRRRDHLDVLASLLAGVGDAIGIYAGFLLAIRIRFFSGWIPLFRDTIPDLNTYWLGAAIATGLLLLIFRALKLYVRPQLGRFEDGIPRLVRAVGLGVLLTMTLPFLLRSEYSFSRTTVALSFFTILLAVLIERYLLFRYEMHLYRHRKSSHRALILGTNSIAARLREVLHREPRLACRIAGFLRTGENDPLDPGIQAEEVLGRESELIEWLDRGEIDRVILTDGRLEPARVVDILMECERRVMLFQMVPDLFRVLTHKVDIQTVEGIPLLGVSQWPLDRLWNRVAKRAEDIVGAMVGLLISAPVLAVAAVCIKRSSPGPVFYRQERCGEGGRRFMLYKLRTMRMDAEAKSGPVWTTEEDPRRTRVGAFLRRYNLDELPQFWNVLRGDMSLVGPRPERPFFVEQFREDIRRYMWRHVSRPGLTGWAQVNGLRGNTDIRERLTYDMY